MGKAQSIADRIKSTKKRFEDALDGVSSTLDEFDALEPQVVSGAKTIAGTLKADANELLDELKQLSNLPFDQSPSGSGTATGASKPSEAGLPKAGNINAPAATPGGSGGTAGNEPFPGNKV